ncbi:MAG: hypothetical protein AAF761_04295, partial [Pseudomonadota bacterium]
MDFDLAFAPLLPWPFVWAVAAAAALFAVLAVWRGLPGWWLRALGFGALILALSGPVLRQEERENLSNIVFVVADRSESQAVDVRPDQVETGLAALRARIGALDNFELRFIEVENDPGL